MNDLNELVLSLVEKETVNQGHVYVQDRNVDYTSGHNETEKQRVAQPPVVEENKQVTSEAEKLGTDEAPIIEYAEEPLLPLVDACAPLIDILHDLSVYVNMALEETPEEPPDGLTFNESAAIRLYTIEWTSPHRSLYSMLNYTLKNCSREELRPYFKRPWYRKKRIVIPLALLVTMCIVATVIGAILGTRAANKEPLNKEDGTISVLEINEDGTLDFQMYYAVGNEPISALCGDFDNNSVIDVAVLNRYQYDVGTDPISMISADFNNDLKLDLVLVNQGGNNISVLIGDIDGNFQTPVMYDVGKQPTFVVLGDFNNDTKLDLAVSNNGSTFISVLFGNENGTFQTQVPCEVGNGTNTVAAADLNNDGILDLVATISGESNVIVLFGNRNGSFQGGVKYQISTNSTAMIAADFNNDSRPDLALTNMDDNTISILINYGNGTFQSQVKYNFRSDSG
ncbi:unnamed protein product [Rotaria sordida]|uniref:VCBS repeat-containing protein n=1 Tax=Rotaria sordida TaxID=392033 RepID=A0A818MC81_9BILA|nr:unnamed protein product [Rotaria sordida]